MDRRLWLDVATCTVCVWFSGVIDIWNEPVNAIDTFSKAMGTWRMM